MADEEEVYLALLIPNDTRSKYVQHYRGIPCKDLIDYFVDNSGLELIFSSRDQKLETTNFIGQLREALNISLGELFPPHPINIPVKLTSIVYNELKKREKIKSYGYTIGLP